MVGKEQKQEEAGRYQGQVRTIPKWKPCPHGGEGTMGKAENENEYAGGRKGRMGQQQPGGVAVGTQENGFIWEDREGCFGN